MHTTTCLLSGWRASIASEFRDEACDCCTPLFFICQSLKTITDLTIADLAGVSLLSIVIVGDAPVPDSTCLWQKNWQSSSLVFWGQQKTENYLSEASDRLKGAQRLLIGQRVIRSCDTNKPKWRQNCSIGTFRQFIEPPYLWLLKGLRHFLMFWASFNKQQNWETSHKVN